MNKEYVIADDKIANHIPDNLYILFNENIDIRGGYPYYWENSDPLRMTIKGDVIEVDHNVTTNSNYGAKINGRIIRTDNLVIQQGISVKFNEDDYYKVYNRFVHLRTVLQLCYDTMMNVNMDFAFELYKWRTTNKFVIYFAPHYYYDQPMTVQTYKYV